jgi:molecular chaperone IbpA
MQGKLPKRSCLTKENTMNALTRFDTTALQQLNRALIGFDRLLSTNGITNQTYPPYNVIKRNDDHYEIEIAVAGFTLSEIEVEVDKNQLIIRGERTREEDSDVEYLHRGLAFRSFEKSLTLGEFMQVGDASIKDGVLRIAVTRIVPEALKPRKIQVVGIDK